MKYMLALTSLMEHLLALTSAAGYLSFGTLLPGTFQELEGWNYWGSYVGRQGRNQNSSSHPPLHSPHPPFCCLPHPTYLQSPRPAYLRSPRPPSCCLLHPQISSSHLPISIILVCQVATVIRVPLADTIDAAFAGDADALQLGTFADDDDGTKLIRVRRTCYVPPAYVLLFLAGDLSPREAWMAVQGQIVIDNRAQECAVLVDYLRAAITISGLGQPPVLTIVPPTAPLADAILLDHRRANCLEQDFPSLNAALPRLQQNQIAVKLGNLVANNRTSRENDRIRRDSEKVKHLSEFIGEQGVITLLRIVGVQAEMQLPPICNELANAKMHRRLSEL